MSAAPTPGEWLRLSDAQRMVWLDLRLGADPAAYQIASRLSVSGRLDLAAARQALLLLQARHEALRLDVDPLQPRQRLLAAPAATLTLHAACDGSAAAVAAWVEALSARPLAPGAGALFAVDALPCGGERFELLFRAHHLVTDHLGLLLALQRWARSYALLIADVPAELPPESRFTATLAADEAYGSSPQAEADLAHWQRRLDPPSPPLFDRPRAATAAPREGWPRRALIEGAAHADWRAACRRAGVTPQRAMAALLALAIGTQRGRRDVTLGLALHRRDRHTQGVVGMFSAAMPARCRWAPDAELQRVVRDTATALDADFRHQRAPVDAIARCIGLAARGQARLFDASLSYVSFGDGDIETAAFDELGLDARVHEVVPAAIVPLPLLMTEQVAQARLDITLGWDPAQLDAGEAESLMDCLLRTVETFCRDPRCAVAELAAVAGDERERLLQGFQAAAMEVPDAPLHVLVEAQAERTPSAVAVVDGDRHISYAELMQRSTLLARRIRAAVGTTHEPVVGVALPRCLDTVVSLLAILQAGGVYLPLDIAHPVARLQYMLDDAEAALLIDGPDSSSLVAPRLNGDTEADLPSVLSSHLAYVIYTSGSTGQPKPVGVPHSAAVNLAFARQLHDPIGPGDRILAAISVGFDVSIGQLLLPLVSGSTIVIAPPLSQLQADAFWALLDRHRVTHINSVPSFFDTVCEALPPGGYRGLKRLMLGGEALTGALARKLQSRLPGTTLVNMYGPTEACIDATAFVVPADGELPASLPIGRPLPNYRAHVVDELGRLAPIGVAGELCLAGAGLARGYLGRPADTAAKFVADPFGPPGSRMYRTGDRARWTHGGQIEFLGRDDEQVKIRGFRVETGEIEAALMQHPSVRTAAVVALPDSRGQKRLAAYIVGELDGLKDWLADRLPEHMIPQAFVQIATLPITTNGKLDKRALPPPDFAAARAEYEPPQGELEALLAEVWQTQLQVPRVGRHDSFFDLGGHSLLAIGMVEQLRQAGWSLEVASVFASPTLASLAAACVPVSNDAEPAPPGIPEGTTHITPEMLPMVALTQQRIDDLVQAVPGGAANVQDVLPLSALQQGMLFHRLMHGRGDPFCTPMVLAFADREALDRVAALLHALVRRHDALRTAFVWQGLPQPLQIVWRDAPLRLELIVPEPGLSALDRLIAQLDARLHRLDLSHAPVMHAVALHDAAGSRWLLGLALHHLVLDHRSIARLMGELALLGQDRGLPPTLPLRHVAWALSRRGDEAAQQAYFRAELAEVDAPTTPFGLEALPGEEAVLRDHRHALPAPLSAALRSRARAAGVSLSALLHLGWSLVLSRTAGRTDVVFGTVLAGRSDPALAQAMGMLINTLPLRVRLAGRGVDAALREVQSSLAALLKHDQAPLALAQRCSGVAAPAPLFTALFNHRQHAGADAGLPGTELVWAQERTGYPLALAVDDDGTGLSLAVQSQVPVDPLQVARLMQAALLALAEASPDAACDGLVIEDAVERDRLLHGFQAAAMEVPSEPLHVLVAAQAERTPTAVAVVDGDRQISYAELMQRSTLLARRIRSAVGTAHEPVIGVALPRSLDTVVSLLAILQAGGVYLPLDIAHPVARLQYMLDDAGAALLIDGPESSSLVASRLDSAAEAALPSVSQAQLAYVIYTSGSTGQPKPVGVPHSAAVNLAYARQLHDPIGPGDRILAAISVGFDVSIGQLLLPLVSGSTIVIAPPLSQLQADAFWALLDRHRVTHINSVPSFFDTVCEALPPGGYRGLKRLMLGGEALTGALARKLQARLPGTTLVNMYGPTEACIDATAFVVPDEGELPASLPIGRPLPNYRAHIVDELGRLAPIGVAGELCLAAAGLARGYLGRPSDTAAKFVADPFGPPGSRMYRTGDRARWTHGGQIEFLGRDDEQVKIRGFRVETGEIEAALMQHPSVRTAAVVALPDARGQKRLAAYIVGELDGLKDWLAERLPEHMIPQAFVQIASLPITTNGKLDKRALPPPDFAAARAEYEPPQGELEALLAEVWQTQLQVPRVGRHDSFFDLGGHSLLAIGMVEQLRQAGWSLEVASVFASPTLASLAAACVPVSNDAEPAPPGIPEGTTHITPEMLPMVALTQQRIDDLVQAVPGGAANVQDVLPLSALQQGMLFHHLVQPQGDVFLTPFVLGFAHESGLLACVEALRQSVARHDILRTAMAWSDEGEPVQVVWRRAALELHRLDLDPGDDALARLRARMDPTRLRLDLAYAPLMRLTAVHDAAQRRWLLGLLLHHLVLDHASMQTLLREMGLIASGRSDALGAPVPLRDVAWALSRRGDEAAQQAHFRAELAEVDAPTTPFGLEALPGEDAVLRDQRHELPAALSAALRSRARAAGVSLSALLHLGWSLVLSRTAGRTDVVFGTVLAGRSDPALAQAMGMLINTLPLRVRLAGRGVDAALREVQAGLAALLKHDQAPLALAQRCSGVAAPAPLFTALFNHRQHAGADTGLPGAELVWAQERTGYPLALAVDDDGTGLSLAVQSQVPVDPLQVARLMQAALLALAEASPDAACDGLVIEDAVERDRLLHGFQAAAMEVPSEPLHVLIAAQAERTPSAVAVVDGDRQISYAELMQRSALLARRIRAAVGTAHEPVIGVALPRSLDTVVSLVAILQAGGVYLPLDFAHPVARLQYMLDDAGAALLIDGPESAALQAPRLSGEAVASLPEVASSSLAYVIYTSGSTGQPKPVGVPHSAAVNLAYARQLHDPIGPGDRILAAISVGFDVSIGQLLLPLLSGSTIVIAPPLSQLQADAFWALLDRHRVTHINSVPSFFDTVCEALPPGGYRGLKRLMLGGEALTGALARKLQSRLPGTTLVNMYGPTEACIDATAFVVPADGELPASLPIGRPLPNYRVHVVDELGRLAPIGVAGELCLAGAGLARGYLGRPADTAAKFVADPFGPPGSRMYRTGDRARWTHDGQIEFLGRNDEQVKIRGFRVETGEIEVALMQHPGVRTAAVVALPDARGQKRLAAYIVGELDGLKDWLSDRLPEHMIPQAFVQIASLPITTNGKLDKRALPPPDFAAARAEYEPPQGELEALLAEVWQTQLQVPRVGRHDSFFDLGGHSLLAIRLVHACVAAARESGIAEAARRLALRDLLAEPTVAAMAARLQGLARAGHPLLVPLRRGDDGRRGLFCVHPQSGWVWSFNEIAQSLPEGLPVWGLQARGLAEGERPHATLAAMVDDLLSAVRSAQPQGPYRLLGYSSGGVLAQAMACALVDAGEAVELLVLLDTPVPDGRGADEVDDALVLADAAHLFEMFAPPGAPGAPRDAAELAQALRRLELAGEDFDEAAAQRLLATSGAILRACRGHRPRAADLPLLQVRALQREDALPDWAPLAPAGSCETHDLDTDHLQLVGPAFAPVLAGLLQARL